MDFTPPVSRNREVLGGDVAYFDYNEGLYYQTKASLLRFLHPINPFSLPHESNEKHVGKPAPYPRHRPS